jgi:hypothetical protein
MDQNIIRTYEFTIILAEFDELTAEVGDALLGAGCDDATPSSEGPTISMDFHREAASLGGAVGSAIKDVERAGFKVARVEVEGPVTAGLSAAGRPGA